MLLATSLFANTLPSILSSILRGSFGWMLPLSTAGQLSGRSLTAGAHGGQLQKHCCGLQRRGHTQLGGQHGEGEPGALSEALPSTVTTLSHAGHYLCHHLVGNQPIYLPLWVFVSSPPNGGEETSHSENYVQQGAIHLKQHHLFMINATPHIHLAFPPWAPTSCGPRREGLLSDSMVPASPPLRLIRKERAVPPKGTCL